MASIPIVKCSPKDYARAIEDNAEIIRILEVISLGQRKNVL